MTINFTLIKKYREEINKLLDEKPEYRLYQNYIDSIIRNSGSSHNACVLLQIKMKEKVAELQKVCYDLQELRRKLCQFK